MRDDIGALLSKLGRRDLSYREFADQFGDMELWPIFEALLIDARIVGKETTPLQAKRERIVPTAPADYNVHPFTARRRASPPASDAGRNEVRAFLNRLK